MPTSANFFNPPARAPGAVTPSNFYPPSTRITPSTFYARSTVPPATPVTPTAPTGVATSDLANQTIDSMRTGVDTVQQQVDTHTATKAANPPVSSKNSIVDLLNSKGQASDFKSRAQLAQQAGIQNYIGTATQNQQLMGFINSQSGSKASGTSQNGTPQGGTTQNGTTTQNGGTTTKVSDQTNQQQPNGTSLDFANTGSPGDVYNQPLQQNLDESQAGYEQFSDKVHQVENGTFPLTASQQASLNATKAQFAQIAQQQLIANKSYEAMVALAGNRLGLNVQDPQQYFAKQQQAISDDLDKINHLDATAQKTLADLQQGFMDKAYDQIYKDYGIFRDLQKEKADTITKVQDRTDKLWTDTRNYNLQVQSHALEAQKFAFEVKQNGYKIVNGQFVPDTALPANGVIAPGKTGNSLLDANTKISATDVPYIDGTNLSGKDASNMQHLAASFGIPYLGKDQADAQANIETARQNMQLITTSLDGILPKNGFGRLFDLSGNGHTSLGNILKGVFQSNEQIASFNAYRSAAIQGLRAMAGSKGLRINQAEILQSVNNDIPKVTDSVATARAKIAKVNSMLNSQERGMYGSRIYDTYNPQAASADLQTYYNASPDHASQVDAILKQNPTLTDAQVLQLTQP